MAPGSAIAVPGYDRCGPLEHPARSHCCQAEHGLDMTDWKVKGKQAKIAKIVNVGRSRCDGLPGRCGVAAALAGLGHDSPGTVRSVAPAMQPGEK